MSLSPCQIVGTVHAITSQNSHRISTVQASTAIVSTIFHTLEKPRLIHKSGNPSAAVTKNSVNTTSHGLSTACRQDGVVG